MLAKLVLENGQIFTGRVFSNGQDCLGELIFNTAMSGYEEVLTDPSYKEQLVLMTYPLIGNYGINEEDKQSKNLHLSALLVKEYIDFPSNFRSKKSLKTYLEEHHILGVEGIDTRYITRNLRHAGALNAFLTTSTEPDEVLIEQVKTFRGLRGKNLSALVSTKDVYTWKTPASTRFKVAVLDCGVKYGILDQLTACDCQCTVFPYDTPAENIVSGGFDGVMISNGPGDPEAVSEAISTIQSITGKLPLFGICLGHQMLSIAFGFKMGKLPFGHHGVNHPIKNVFTDEVEITSQNHIYCTQKEPIHSKFEVSHLNLNDQTIAGIRSESLRAFSVQYHPEAAPGPNDSHYLFKEFTHLMEHGTFDLLSSKKKILTKGN